MKTSKVAAISLLSIWAVQCAPGVGKETGSRTEPGAEIAAYIGDEAITVADVDQEAAAALKGIRQQEFDVRSRGLEEIINRKLLETEAASRGISVEELIGSEVEEKIEAPTDASIETFYNANKGRLGGRTLEETQSDIRNYLVHQQRVRLNTELVQALRERAGVRVLLEPPRTEMSIPAGEPSLGPEDTTVTVVEFSDFQCPYCKRAHPTVERILAEYGDRIRFVYRDYPLPNHPRAFPASEAARCASEQDKYWEYHGNLMTVVGDLSDADLRKRAGELSLDLDAFSACLESDRHEAAIRASMAAGAEAGVSGTPAFFINGRLLSGAQPFEVFQRVLDDELARATAAN